MYKFPELIKKIRNEAGLTQAEFAGAIDVSPVLIAMVESGQKEVSKKLLLKIADRLEVSPASITPFLYGSEAAAGRKLSVIERQFLALGIKLQEHLISTKSHNLLKYAKQPISANSRS
jgi:transcriptional regulator with XRE-family HTH domain